MVNIHRCGVVTLVSYWRVTHAVGCDTTSSGDDGIADRPDSGRNHTKPNVFSHFHLVVYLLMRFGESVLGCLFCIGLNVVVSIDFIVC